MGGAASSKDHVRLDVFVLLQIPVAKHLFGCGITKKMGIQVLDVEIDVIFRLIFEDVMDFTIDEASRGVGDALLIEHENAAVLLCVCR